MKHIRDLIATRIAITINLIGVLSLIYVVCIWGIKLHRKLPEQMHMW